MLWEHVNDNLTTTESEVERREGERLLAAIDTGLLADVIRTELAPPTKPYLGE